MCGGGCRALAFDGVAAGAAQSSLMNPTEGANRRIKLGLRVSF
jgi:hypothetical protein